MAGGCTMCLFTVPNALDEPVTAYGEGAGGGMGGGLAPMEVGPPCNVKHVFHVTFDSAQGFVGLPPELKAQLEGLELEHAGQAAGDNAAESPSNSGAVFGVPPETLERSDDEHGNSIPTVLLALQRRLYSLDGLQKEGIFRVSGQLGDEGVVRRLLARGSVPENLDVHALAGLIKAWFRELPSGILDAVSPPEMAAVNGEEAALALFQKLPAVQAALLDWVLNLMADVVDHEAENRMNARNIAMVFAPNLSQVVDPLVGLQHAVKVMDVLGLLIRKKQADRRAAAATLLQQSTFYTAGGDTDGTPQRAADGSATLGAAGAVGATVAGAAAAAAGSGSTDVLAGVDSEASGPAAAGMTQAANTSRGAGSEQRGPATRRPAEEEGGLSAHGAGPSRLREASGGAERRSGPGGSGEEKMKGCDDVEMEADAGRDQDSEADRPGEGEGAKARENRAGDPKANQPRRSPKHRLRMVASTGISDGQAPPGLADKPRPLKSTGKRAARRVAQSGPVGLPAQWDEEDEGSGRGAKAGNSSGVSRNTSVGRAVGAGLKDSSAAASYASDWSDGGDRQRRRGQKAQEPEREAGHASDAEMLPRAQSLGPLKRFHALRVKLAGEKGVVGEPELAEDWAVPMSPLDAELLRASGVTPLRTLSAVAEQQRASAAQQAGTAPSAPGAGGAGGAGGAASVASTPKGGDRTRKGKKGAAFDLVSPREEFGIGPPWVNYLQDRPSSERRGRAEKEGEERPSSERKGRTAAQEVQLDARPSSEKKARAAADSKMGRAELEKATSERRRSGEGGGGVQRRGGEEGSFRRGASLHRNLGEPQPTAGGSEDWGRGGFTDLGEPEGEGESRQRSRPPSQGEPRTRRASHLRQLLQTEQSSQQQQQHLRSQWEALGPSDGESCEVVMVEEGEEQEKEEEEKEVVVQRKGRRGRGLRETVSHDFTSAASDHSGSVSTEAEARRDEDAGLQGSRASEGEPSRPQGKPRWGMDPKWASHADRHGSDALLSPRLLHGAEDSDRASGSSQQAEDPAEGKPRKKGKGKGGSRGVEVGSSDPNLNPNNPAVVRSSSDRKVRQQGDSGGQAEGFRARGKGGERPGGAQSAAERLSQHVLSALYGPSSEGSHASGDRKGKQPERQATSERGARPRVAMSDMGLSWGYSGGVITAAEGAAQETPALATPRRPATDRKAREGREDAGGGTEERKQGKGGVERAMSVSGRTVAAEGAGGLKKAATERRAKIGEVLGSGEKQTAGKGAQERKPGRTAASPATAGEGQPLVRGSGDPSGEEREAKEVATSFARSSSSSKWFAGGVLEGVMSSPRGVHRGAF